MVGYSDFGFTKVLAGILFGVGCDHHDRSHRAGNCGIDGGVAAASRTSGNSRADSGAARGIGHKDPPYRVCLNENFGVPPSLQSFYPTRIISNVL